MFGQNHLFAARVAALALVWIVLPASGTSVDLYSDRSTWQGAVPGFSNVDFSGIAMTEGSLVSYSTASGLTLLGVNFVGLLSATPSYELLVINPGATWGNNFNSGSVLRGPGYFSDPFEQLIRVSLPGGINAFGVDLMSQDPDSLPFRIVLSTGDIFTNVATLPRPNRAFFGVTSPADIAQIDFILQTGVSSGSFPLLDNFSFGAYSAALPPPGDPPPPPGGAETPEAATLLYVATGVSLLWIYRRRRVPPSEQ